MKRWILSLALLAGTPFAVTAQPLPEVQRDSIKAEIRGLYDEQQGHFREGRCEDVVARFHEDVTFYTRGRELSRPALLNVCLGVERPFPEAREDTTRIEVLSEHSAYIVRTIEFPTLRDDGEATIVHEIITQVWRWESDGWRIVHVHVSIDAVS